MKIGDFEIGKSGVFLVAEIGQNHNGSYLIAKKLIQEASKAGFDAVKFQKGNCGRIYKQEYLDRVYKQGETYAEHRDKLELTNEEFKLLYKDALHNDIQMFVSCFDLDTVDFLNDEIGVPCFKIASRDITSIPLLKKIAKIGKPVILSTGMSTMTEIDEATEIMFNADCPFILLQCVSSYPAPYEELNLNVIKKYKNMYGCPVGFSDHTLGCSQAAIASIALGASVIEKHITKGRWQGGDHACALEAPFGTQKFVRDIRNIETALGNKKVVEKSEKSKLYLRTALSPERFK